MKESVQRIAGRTTRSRFHPVVTIAAVAAAALLLAGCSSTAATPNTDGPVKASLIGIDITNPYYLKMSKDAKAEAKAKNVELTIQADTTSSGADTVTSQIEQAVAGGAKAILIDPAAGPGINPALKKARAAGVLVVAVDNPTSPANVVDMAYVTGNLSVAKSLGTGVAKSLGGKKAVIAMLDAFEGKVIQVDVDRDQGFLSGMGIDLANPAANADEAKTGTYSGGDYQIVCNQQTQATQDGGRTAMENCLSKNPNINVVYTINEPAAFGAYQAMKAASKTAGVTVATFDGSCDGIAALKRGEITVDAQTYPGKQGKLGIDAAVAWAKHKTKPSPSSGLDYFNTGSSLVSAQAISGVTTISPADAAGLCF